MAETATHGDDLHGFDRGEADSIIDEAAAAYFKGCHDRVAPFVARNYSFWGSLKLHRHALGWDVLKAPANAMLSLPQIGINLTALGARSLGARRLAARLQRQNILLQTAVARELRWRLITDLLEQPMRDGDRVSERDGLAEAILAHPKVQDLVEDAAEMAGRRKDDPVFRGRLEEALTEYTGTRSAASEIATALIALGTGAIAFQQATPGAIALGPIIAVALAQQAAIASFPLGATAGGIWYGFFPAQASPLLVAGSTAGLMGAAALTAAFAGVVTDPVQKSMGLHHRRLHTLIDSLEETFKATDSTGYVAYDLYVARLMDLSDVLISVARAFRP